MNASETIEAIMKMDEDHLIFLIYQLSQELSKRHGLIKEAE